MFAGVLLIKAMLASACVTDGWVTANTVTPPASASTDAAPSPWDTGDDGACWHAGAVGCHCGCAHASALPVPGLALRPAVPLDDAPATVQPLKLRYPCATELRPPIA